MPHAQIRYVVVDTETTGLDLRRDRVIAIGAAAVDRGRLRLSDCFETVLRQDQASADANILIHGIGGQTQLHGVEPRAGMLDFLEYIGRMPLVAFRAEFDATMLERALKAIVGFPLRRTWIDLAFLLPALFPGTRMPDARRLARPFRARAAPSGIMRWPMRSRPRSCCRSRWPPPTAHDMGTAATLVAMQKAQRWLGKR